MNKKQTNGLAKALKELIAVLEYGNEVHALCEDEHVDNTGERSQDYLRNIAAAVLIGAQARCPVSTGSLRDSAEIVETDTGYDVVFGCGVNEKTGEFIDYATYIHEIGRYRHIVGQAKYLEDAVVEVQSLLLSQGTEVRFGIQYDADFGACSGCMICHIGGGKEGNDINGLENRYASIVKGASIEEDIAYAKEVSNNFTDWRANK